LDDYKLGFGAGDGINPEAGLLKQVVEVFFGSLFCFPALL